jgi:hypothetical protein
MTRPFMRHRIDELEVLFESCREDADGLRRLETELTFRQVPRAVSLLLKVRKVIGGGEVRANDKQQDLFGNEALIPPPTLSRAPKHSSEPPAFPAVPGNSFPPALAVSMSDIENAYKTLRVTRAATWETIETSRRQIVDRAHPDAVSRLEARKREALRQEASRANAPIS